MGSLSTYLRQHDQKVVASSNNGKATKIVLFLSYYDNFNMKMLLEPNKNMNAKNSFFFSYTQKCACHFQNYEMYKNIDQKRTVLFKK